MGQYGKAAPSPVVRERNEAKESEPTCPEKAVSQVLSFDAPSFHERRSPVRGDCSRSLDSPSGRIKKALDGFTTEDHAISMNVEVAAKQLEALGNPTRLAIYRTLVRAGDTGLPVGQVQERLGWWRRPFPITCTE